MSFINYVAQEVHCKIIYFGAGLSGKTTNIQYIFDQTQSQSATQGSSLSEDNRETKLITLSSENERTLFFDFLPLSVGEINGYKTRFHLYSVPGQTFYELSQQFIVKGVDGIVFVVDSNPEQMEANVNSFEALRKHLDYQGYDIERLPLVFQYNKRDIQGALPIDILNKTFNSMKRPFIEAVANKGVGVMETLETISEWIIKELRSGEQP